MRTPSHDHSMSLKQASRAPLRSSATFVTIPEKRQISGYSLCMQAQPWPLKWLLFSAGA